METQTNNQPSTYSIESNAPVVKLSDWMITILLLAIPIVNIIMLFVWAFGGGTNPSKSNYAKAVLLWIVISIVGYVLIFLVIIGALLSNI